MAPCPISAYQSHVCSAHIAVRWADGSVYASQSMLQPTLHCMYVRALIRMDLTGVKSHNRKRRVTRVSSTEGADDSATSHKLLTTRKYRRHETDDEAGSYARTHSAGLPSVVELLRRID